MKSTPSPCLEASCPPITSPCPHNAASIAPDGSRESDQDVAAFSDADNDDSEQENEDTAPSGSEDDGLSHSRRRPRIHFTVQQLQTVYHLPLKTAAERLGVCEAALKRICRRNRIFKWPYRQLASVRRRMADLKERRMARTKYDVSAVQDSQCSFSVEEFGADLQELEEEQARIIQAACQPRRLTVQASRPKTVASSRQQEEVKRIPEEMQEIQLQDFRSKIADLPPLDLRQVDRDFPLLFLANVCESVRAHD